MEHELLPFCAHKNADSLLAEKTVLSLVSVHCEICIENTNPSSLSNKVPFEAVVILQTWGHRLLDC